MESIKKIIIKNKLLILIILIGAFLRFYRLPAYVEFLGDQGRDVLQVRDFLVNRDLMFIGPRTSIGDMYLGPWYYYLMAPFLLVANYNPLGPVVMVILFSLATVYLLYKIGDEWFNNQAGIIAAGLGAVSPVLIKFSTFSWNPNIMPFFSLLSIWLTYRIWQKKEYKKMIWLAVSLAMVLNSHYLGLLLFPPIGLFLIITFIRDLQTNKKNKLLKNSLILLLVFSLLMSPLLIFDLKHNWMNFNAFKTFLANSQTSSRFQVSAVFKNLLPISKQLISQLLANQDWNWIGIIIFFGLIYVFLKSSKKNSLLLINASLIFGLLGLAVYNQSLYAHYFGFLYPLMILAVSYLLSQLKLFGWGLFILVSGLMLSNWHGFKSPNNQLPRTREISNFICDQKSANKQFNIVNLSTYKDYRAQAYRYFVVKDCPNNLLGKEEYPQSDALFIIQEDKQLDPLETDIWEIKSLGKLKIMKQSEVAGVEVYQLEKNI